MSSTMTDKKIDGIDAWEVRDAASTLIRAEEIQQDTKLYKAALKVVDVKMKAAAQAKLDTINSVSKSKSNDPSKQPTVTIQA